MFCSISCLKSNKANVLLECFCECNVCSCVICLHQAVKYLRYMDGKFWKYLVRCLFEQNRNTRSVETWVVWSNQRLTFWMKTWVLLDHSLSSTERWANFSSVRNVEHAVLILSARTTWWEACAMMVTFNLKSVPRQDLQFDISTKSTFVNYLQRYFNVHLIHFNSLLKLLKVLHTWRLCEVLYRPNCLCQMHFLISDLVFKIKWTSLGYSDPVNIIVHD